MYCKAVHVGYILSRKRSSMDKINDVCSVVLACDRGAYIASLRITSSYVTIVLNVEA